MKNQELTQNIIFFDIETVPQTIEANPSLCEIAEFIKPKDFTLTTEEFIEQHGGLYPEIAQIICIGVMFNDENYIISAKKMSEIDILNKFNSFLDYAQTKIVPRGTSIQLCGHNIKKFDLPFIMKRCIINEIKIHPFLDIRNKAPWEIKNIIDTKELWTFRENGVKSSLAMLAKLLGIPSPKENIDGSKVNEYYQNGKIDEIEKYCLADVLACKRLFIKLNI